MMEQLPKPITKHCMEILLNQMNNSICWINQKKENYEMGLFIYFKYQDKKIPVLLTKYNIIDGNNCNILNISLNDESKTIKLGNKRYKNKVLNLAITEIITDKNDAIQFIEIDDNLFKNDLETNYNNKSIYILQNNNKKIIQYLLVK